MISTELIKPIIYNLIASGAYDVLKNNIATRSYEALRKKTILSFLNGKEMNAESQDKRIYTIDELVPEVIMGDKGEERFGFRPDLFYYLPIMDEFAESMLDDRVQIVVITGRFASGKSRMVYEYLKSNICTYDYIYICSTLDNMDLLLKSIDTLDPRNTVVVIDDINMYFDKMAGEDLGIGQLLRKLTKHHLKTIITLSMGEFGYSRFLSGCKSGSDIYRGQQHNAVIQTLEIPRITEGDDFNKWCTANLKACRFSSVVGGYIPGLQRSIDATINSIINNTKAMNVLVSFMVANKFRRNVGRTDSFIRTMYTKRFGDISDSDYEDAIETLKILGLISDDFDYVDDVIAYKQSDRNIYFTFQMQCAQGLMGKNISEVMANTAQAEQRQCDWLLSCGPDDPILYSRAIVHSRLTKSKEYVRDRMEKYLKDNGFTMNTIPNTFLSNPIPAILEFSGVQGYKVLRNAIEEKGLIPTIEIVNSIIRIAPHTMLRNEILDYAQELVIKFNLKPNIYYYRCLETVYKGYDLERVRNAKKIYDDSDGYYNADNYQQYSLDLLCKAVSGNDSIVFWEKIAPIGLKINQKSVRNYCHAINKSARNMLAEKLYIDFWNESSKFGWDLNRTSVIWTLISLSPMFSTSYFLYTEAIKTLTPEDYHDYALNEDDLKCRLLHPLLGKLSYKRKDDMKIIYQLVEELLNSGNNRNAEWYSSRKKILNNYLSKHGQYSDFEDDLKKLTKGDSNLVDNVTISSALKVVKTSVYYNPLYTVTDAVNDIRNIVNLRTEYNIKRDDPAANTTLYAIVNKLLKHGLDFETADELKGYADGEIDKENEKSYAARISCILTENEAIKEANNQITKLQSVISSRIYYYNPDLISNLILATLTRINNSDIMIRKIDEIINLYERFIDVPNHSYYRQILRYDIETKKLCTGDIIKEINHLNDRLLSAHMPLVENNKDLFRVAMKMDYIDVTMALQLLKEVNRQSTIEPIKESLWTGKIVKIFIMKILRNKNNNLTGEEIVGIIMKDLQGMIDSHINIDYTPEIDTIIKAIKIIKKQYHLPKYFSLYFPLSSIKPEIRHRALNYYFNTNSLRSIHDTSLKHFIENEEIWLKKNPKLDRNYLEMARKELESRQRTSVNDTLEEVYNPKG